MAIRQIKSEKSSEPDNTPTEALPFHKLIWLITLEVVSTGVMTAINEALMSKMTITRKFASIMVFDL